MKKLIAALCFLIFLKTVTTPASATPVVFNSHADTTKPVTRTPTPDSTSLEDSAASIADTLKTVKVKGYYRKDGKYVAPYTRRAPSKKH